MLNNERMRKSKLAFLMNYAFLVLLLLATLQVYTDNHSLHNPHVIASNVIIVVLSLVFMFVGDKYNFSLNKVFMLFVFFFLGIAPVLQYQRGTVLWGGAYFSDAQYIRINSLIILIVCVYQGLYWVFGMLKLNRLERWVVRKSCSKIRLSRTRLLLLAGASSLITLYMHKFSLFNLFFRSGERVSIDQSLELVYSTIVRPMPLVCLVIAQIHGVGGRLYRFTLLVLVLLTNFPTANARFYVAATYLPLLLAYFPFVSRKYMALNRILIIGLLIVFPFLDQMRRITSLADITFRLDFYMFTTEHFDSYQMFMRVLNNNVVTYGRQLLTVLLFFVPRSWWPGKSVGSGHLIARMSNLPWRNVSMNFFGEGYINFGYIGILLFTVVIAYANARCDKIFWMRHNTVSLLSTLYFLWLGLELFVLRGDLLSSFSFTVGLTGCVVLVYFLSSLGSADK